MSLLTALNFGEQRHVPVEDKRRAPLVKEERPISFSTTQGGAAYAPGLAVVPGARLGFVSFAALWSALVKTSLPLPKSL